ncbi:MAG: DUF5050 domain-containing protein [Bacteroidota bacterium]
MSIMSCGDDATVNPQPPSSAENIVFYNQVDAYGEILSVYRISGDGTGKVKIADTAAIWGHSFKNKIVYSKFAGNTTEIVIANADGTGSKTIKTINESSVRCALSPDAMKVMYYFYVESGLSSYTAIHCMNIDGTEDITLVPLAANETIPMFSPDGSQVAFLKDVKEDALRHSDSLFIINTNGTGERFIAAGMENVSDYIDVLDWSPDGKKIVAENRNNGNIIMIVTIANGAVEFINNTVTLFSPVWAPNNREIAFTGFEGGKFYLNTMNSDGSAQKKLTPPASKTAVPSFIQWPLDGTSLLYTEYSLDKKYGPLKLINRNTLQTITLDERALRGYWKK